MKYKIRLDSGELDKLATQIDAYSNDLKYKCDLFVYRMAQLGVPIVDARMNSTIAPIEQPYLTYIRLHSFGSYSQAVLFLEGREVLFVEFGAGVHYNGSTSPNPYATKFGYQIGTYGQGNGKKDVWAYYDSSGNLRMTHGTKATMPMYKTYSYWVNNLNRIAKSIFKT